MNKLVFNKKEQDFKKLKKESDRWLAHNFYYGSRETQYRKIKPQLIFEKILFDQKGDIPSDYKFHCFAQAHQQNTIIQVDSGRFNHHTRDYFTTDWERLPLQVKYPNSPFETLPERPTRLEALIDTAWQLAEGFAYVRVDLYLIGERIFFGEMTFTPGSGFERFHPASFDKQWGDWLDLDHQLSLFTHRDLESARRAQRKALQSASD